MKGYWHIEWCGYILVDSGDGSVFFSSFENAERVANKLSPPGEVKVSDECVLVFFGVNI